MEGRAIAQANQAKLQRVAIMSVCFDSLLKRGVPQEEASRTLDVMDLAEMVAARYGVRNIELQHAHLLGTDADYFKMLRDRLAKAKSQITQINLEFGQSNLSAAGFSARGQAMDLTRSWIDHAAALGCPRVMVNPGSLAPEQRQAAVDGLKILAGYGQPRKVQITLENRDTGVAAAAPAPAPPPLPPPAGPPAAAGGRQGGGGGRGAAPPPPPATWQVVVDVIKAAGLFATPNIGNFPNDTERAAGLKVLYGMTAGTSHCRHDKSYFADAIKISKDAGYKGLYAIETAPAGGADPHAAVKMALDELIKLI